MSDKTESGFPIGKVAQTLRKILYPALTEHQVEAIMVLLMSHLLIEQKINHVLYDWLKQDAPCPPEKAQEVLQAENRLEILQMFRFDLVITDFVMPKLNGIKFVEQLHTLQPRFPIIFITGYLSAISGKAILDEVAEVLQKPFEPDLLRSTVQRLLHDSAPF
jgi:CheY-like chemotaxis protein